MTRMVLGYGRGKGAGPGKLRAAPAAGHRIEGNVLFVSPRGLDGNDFPLVCSTLLRMMEGCLLLFWGCVLTSCLHLEWNLTACREYGIVIESFKVYVGMYSYLYCICLLLNNFNIIKQISSMFDLE